MVSLKVVHSCKLPLIENNKKTKCHIFLYTQTRCTIRTRLSRVRVSKMILLETTLSVVNKYGTGDLLTNVQLE